MDSDIKIVAVVVTYNRLNLLRECLATFYSMELRPIKVIIIDNASTDGTSEYLKTFKSDSLFEIIRLNMNVGGAGGFSTGIRCAMQYDCDGIWLMDDDTIPRWDSLKFLCRTLLRDKTIGFACSRVIWTDGSDHEMNRPYFISKNDSNETIREIESASFVSIVIRKSIVSKIGLPYKEFFIWDDDSEYTQRITKNNYKGKYVSNSIVVHKTPWNYGPSISNAPVATAWKFYYGQRNAMFMNRQRYGSGLKFYIKELNHLRLALHNVNKRKHNERSIFRKEILRGFLDGLTFNPKIDYIQ